MKKIEVEITEPQLRKLVTICEKTRMTQSEIMRKALNHWFRIFEEMDRTAEKWK